MRPLSPLLLLLAATSGLHAEQPLPPQLQGVGIDEKLGEPVDLNLTFTAENGYPVALREFFHKDQPVILNLVYYSCPMLCTLVLNGQTTALREHSLELPGRSSRWSPSASIRPRRSGSRSRRGPATWNSTAGPRPGWHFLVDREGNVKKLAEQVGFHYRYDEQQTAVRARGGHHGADAGRQGVALPLRHQVQAAGPAAGARRGRGSEILDQRGPGAAATASTTIRRRAATSCSRRTSCARAACSRWLCSQ